MYNDKNNTSSTGSMGNTLITVEGTNGNDFLGFQGEIGNFNATLTNAYSGATISFDEEKNINSASYEGFSGIDTLYMSSIGDVLTITDNIGAQVFSNIEQIIAGDGGDVISLDHETITLGDLYIAGGGGDDLIWGNAGDDTINGSSGNDILDGGPGNDTINGQQDHDVLSGGDGDDTLNGGDGHDLIQGNAGNDMFFFTPDFEWAGFWGARNVGSPGNAGTNEFVPIAGKKGTNDVFDGGAGFDTMILSTGDDALFVWDGYSAFNENATDIRIIGIEEIYAGSGDDVVDFTHPVYPYSSIIIHGETGDDHLWSSLGDDTLYGGSGDDNLWGDAGNDMLYGGDNDDILRGSTGSDTLDGGAGADTLYGGADSDKFVLSVLDGFIDTIGDFEIGNLGDSLNISDLLEGYDPLTDLLENFVQLQSNNNNTQININTDGDQGGAFEAAALIIGDFTNSSLLDFVNNGNLIV